MQLSKDKFFASLIAMGLAGSVGCGGEEPATAEPEPAASAGSETAVADPMEEPDPAMEPIEEEPMGQEPGMEPVEEEPAELGPTPE